ncbi:MAG TPA: cysteine dioxygenase family protein [Candidatus Saccharimonadaceae bacterium]|jgi:predicted metal-dependent enzyme (double-stranded beta helix superfamily)|nr:cysteine dioxygenase family protein [Candidatus Saccharimonadaceae bacterium]
MSTMPRTSKVDELIRRLDEAVAARDDAERCRNVKKVLVDVVQSGEQFVEPQYLVPAPDRYARRLMHRDAQNRYTVLAMVWDRGQGTPLHDHAGTWCVECVYRGRIRVTSYSVRGGDPERDVVQFARENVVMAGVGEAGALIPPFEYHVLENADDSPSITLHVYGGEMTYCHIFDPVDGGYLRKYRELSYTA